MKMAWVDGTDQVLVVNSNGELYADPGHLQPRVLRARQGLPDRRHADLRAPPVALRPRERRAARSAGRAAAGGLPGGRRGRPDPHRGPGRPARGQRVTRADHRYECPVSRAPGRRASVARPCNPSMFVGFADDCTITGQVTMFGERLTDFLNGQERFRLHHVECESLATATRSPSTACRSSGPTCSCVVATGPRGSEKQRVSLQTARLQVCDRAVPDPRPAARGAGLRRRWRASCSASR